QPVLGHHDVLSGGGVGGHGGFRSAGGLVGPVVEDGVAVDVLGDAAVLAFVAGVAYAGDGLRRHRYRLVTGVGVPGGGAAERVHEKNGASGMAALRALSIVR